MTLIIEDGTGKTDANSYASVAIADSYFNSRGVSNWFGANGQTSALIRSTDYIELKYSSRFLGQKATGDQSLSFPRINSGIWDSNEIPINLIWACCEYALIALTSDLLLTSQLNSNGLLTYKKREKVGPIETEFALPGIGIGSKVENFKAYPKADLLMSTLIISSRRQVIR